MFCFVFFSSKFSSTLSSSSLPSSMAVSSIIPRTMMKMEGWGSANHCRWVQRAASWSSCCRHRWCCKESMMARKWWNRRIWLIDFMNFARLCVSLLVLFVGFFRVIFLDRERSASRYRYYFCSLCIYTYIHIYIYISYTVSLSFIQFLAQLFVRIRRFTLSHSLSLLSIEEKHVFIYVNLLPLFTLNCMCFMSINECVSALSFAKLRISRYIY